MILTDFSRPAKHAAFYAYSLAKQIQTNIILCNVVIVPAEVPLAGFVAWPLEESDILLKESEVELKKLKMQLEKMDDNAIPNPDITFRSDSGILLDLLVLVHHYQGLLYRLIQGSRTQKLAEDGVIPLLIFKKAPASQLI